MNFSEVYVLPQMKSPNLFFRIAAISIATKLTDLQLGDSVEISRLITKKEMKQAR